MQNFESIVGVNFWTALFTLCNMLITFLILKKLLFKPVKKMIDDRQKEIADQYAEAEARRDRPRGGRACPPPGARHSQCRAGGGQGHHRQGALRHPPGAQEGIQ